MPDLQVLTAALFVALGVAVAWRPPRRERAELPGPRPASRPAIWRQAWRSSRRQDVDLGMVLVEVSTLLRSGAPTPSAWQRVLARRGLLELEPELEAASATQQDGVPAALLALAQASPRSWWPRWEGGRPHWRPPWPRRRVETQVAQQQAARGAVAACRLAHSIGAPLAGVLESVAGAVSEAGRAQASRDTALAGPRSSARLLVALPLAAPLLGEAVGADLWGFFSSGRLGALVLVAGVVLILLGHWLTARLLAAAQAEPVDEALGLDLARAALLAGATVPGTLAALGAALEEGCLTVVSRALLLGSDWDEAWQVAAELDGGAPGNRWARAEGQLAECLRVSWEEGASPLPLLERAACTVRDGRAASAQEAAERLAVRLVLPLGLCHLPAFVLLGVVPVVLDIGGQMLHGG
ncbi:Flp pilus assembly protein TadB [Actinomyces bovis]|uniref:Flp pilus assembly protein TadB n=1 Tax=Actinomyces bovis TaxID=1658 RepID=A0ABY1VSA7_9ACTO|nr:hypothetical protein [Actinomyces bovis]SPT54282.1 Flp pilus assembly protein TadB [Actinomyces bovis]VEG56390.1 Flp pilus assembly protein TadB [Actinomyces israelii]